MKQQSNRQPSVRFLTAQSLFLQVNGKRDQRLQSFQSNQHNKAYALQLTQELEADLGFYCEAQLEVDRLLEENQMLRTQLLHRQLELDLERSIIRDFAKARQLDLELIEFTIAQLKQRLEKTIPNAA